jgi:hypothetical protein
MAVTLDTSQSYREISEELSSIQSFKSVQDATDLLKKKTGDKLEQNKNNLITEYKKVKEAPKKFQQQAKTQLDHLVDLLKQTKPGASETTKYIKKTLFKTAVKVKPEIKKIILDEYSKVLGCSQNQEYVPQSVWVPVTSVDIFQILKSDPASNYGKITFETSDLTTGTIPYPMNKQLYNRLQKLGNSFNQEYNQNYKGASGQDLFNIEYTNTNQSGFTGGDYFKVTLSARQIGVNSIEEFIIDYFETIQLFENQNFFKNLMETIIGSLSVQLPTKTIEVNQKFQKLIQRVMGMCFDNSTEIDVAGTAKVSESDGIDDTFFEMTSIDLRQIDESISLIQRGVVKFEDCDNVELPVDKNSLIQKISQLNNPDVLDNDSKIVEVADELTNTLSNPWSFTIPTGLNISIDTDLIKNLIKGLITSILSPKVLLPLMVMLKAIGNQIVDTIYDAVEFSRKLKSLFLNVVSKVGAIFVKTLTDLLIKDIRNLLVVVQRELTNSSKLKQYQIYVAALNTALTVAKGIRDYRKCKSILDEIKTIIQIAKTLLPTYVPKSIRSLAALKSGYDCTRSVLNQIKELQLVGYPTGPTPSGKPNMKIQTMIAACKGSQKERIDNGKMVGIIPPIDISQLLGAATGPINIDVLES